MAAACPGQGEGLEEKIARLRADTPGVAHVTHFNNAGEGASGCPVQVQSVCVAASESFRKHVLCLIQGFRKPSKPYGRRRDRTPCQGRDRRAEGVPGQRGNIRRVS